VECEKHPNEDEWIAEVVGDRLVGILLQLISNLQSRRCPHFMLDKVRVFRFAQKNKLGMSENSGKFEFFKKCFEAFCQIFS